MTIDKNTLRQIAKLLDTLSLRDARDLMCAMGWADPSMDSLAAFIDSNTQQRLVLKKITDWTTLPMMEPKHSYGGDLYNTPAEPGKIQYIKHIRNVLGLRLREAKDLVDAASTGAYAIGGTMSTNPTGTDQVLYEGCMASEYYEQLSKIGLVVELD